MSRVQNQIDSFAARNFRFSPDELEEMAVEVENYMVNCINEADKQGVEIEDLGFNLYQISGISWMFINPLGPK